MGKTKELKNKLSPAKICKNFVIPIMFVQLWNLPEMLFVLSSAFLDIFFNDIRERIIISIIIININFICKLASLYMHKCSDFKILGN